MSAILDQDSSTPLASTIRLVGRLKSKSQTYQVEKNTILYDSIITALQSMPIFRTKRISGKIIISLNLGGVQGIEFQDTEHL